MDSPDSNEDFAGRLLHQGEISGFLRSGKYNFYVNCESNLSSVSVRSLAGDNDALRDKTWNTIWANRMSSCVISAGPIYLEISEIWSPSRHSVSDIDNQFLQQRLVDVLRPVHDFSFVRGHGSGRFFTMAGDSVTQPGRLVASLNIKVVVAARWLSTLCSGFMFHCYAH